MFLRRNLQHTKNKRNKKMFATFCSDSPLLGRFWPLLGRSWPLLGHSRPLLAAFGPLLERSWPALGRSWAAPGRSWGAPRPSIRPEEKPKTTNIDTKSNSRLQHRSQERTKTVNRGCKNGLRPPKQTHQLDDPATIEKVKDKVQRMWMLPVNNWTGKPSTI